MVCTYYQVCFSSDIGKLRDILREIMVRLKYEISAVSDDALFDLRVVFSELLVNAIIHGNKDNPSKKVVLTLQIDGGTVMSTIKDEGEGFDFPRFQNYISVSSEDIESESGRGLMIVNSLTDSLQFNGSGNEVEFTKNLLSA